MAGSRIIALNRLDPADRFWRVFESKERDWFDRLEEDQEGVFEELGRMLQAIDDNLAFGISEGVEDGQRQLVLSANGIVDSFGSVISLYEAAPKLERWKIVAFRPRMEAAAGFVIRMEELELSCADIYFSWELKDQLIDLKVYIRHFDPADLRFVNAYFILLDSLIGEFDAASRIGETTFARLEDTEGLLTLNKIVRIVDNMI
ncbi:hypothetical protein [Saccharibacillus kuerlensis]|uniref:Uncharacterized protein n=1 Tax=Saccharibacillus kuerlensis TaxID=459527 RepID=A0ABQ2L5C4_9BACL|nr:hypothetical protein [Saccharibacillus kuerlensis]GGO00508.1 hypothetical protein GCM10010969_21830 [Saccharibacillus kuerlensis]